jgi:hypothetical protein
MRVKFVGLVASLVLFCSAQAHATTYLFDTLIGGTYTPAGSVDVSLSGSTATFTVSLPSDYLISKFGLNLNPYGGISSGAYSLVSNSNVGDTDPFTTVLKLNSASSSSLIFTVTDYAGIFSNTGPIWFAVKFSVNGNKDNFFAADYVLPDAPVDATPLPATLPLFAGGAGVMGGLLGWRKKRKKAALRAAA